VITSITTDMAFFEAGATNSGSKILIKFRNYCRQQKKKKSVSISEFWFKLKATYLPYPTLHSAKTCADVIQYIVTVPGLKFLLMRQYMYIAASFNNIAPHIGREVCLPPFKHFHRGFETNLGLGCMLFQGSSRNC
jgi:hypothetical protein